MALNRRSTILLLSSALGANTLVKRAKALDYPVRPIRFIVPYATGGGADIAARLFGAEAGQVLGQQLVIENHGGASGVIGAEITAKASPDGYTIMLGTANWTISPSLFRKLPYNVTTDFVPVTLLAKTPSIIAVNPSVKAHSLNELIALAKTSPGEMNYASDVAGPQYLGMELFKSMAGIQITNVPYTGTGPGVVATIANQVSVDIAPASLLLAFIKSGQLRGLAVTSDKRIEAAPEIPTVAESGFKGYDVNQWYGVLVPSGTPPEIVSVLNIAFLKTLQSPALRARLVDQAMIPVGGGPGELASFIERDVERWAKAVKISGLPLN